MDERLSEDLFKQFQNFLVEESGLYVNFDRVENLEEKLRERMKVCEVKTFADYYHYLRFNPRARLELKSLLDIITIGETYFFRNEPQFEALGGYVLPRILETNTDHKLRIWCAGCSTGEEAYSLALFLKTIPELASWDISILATDVNRNSLKVAAEGIYGARSVNLVPANLLHLYFTQKGRKYWISPSIKNMVHFEYHNLARDSYTLNGMRNLDILFCRNVTIYFDINTLKRVIAQFADCIKPDGYFFIGHAETLWNISNAFTPIEFPKTFIYQKLSEPSIGDLTAPHIPLSSFNNEESMTLNLEDAPQNANQPINSSASPDLGTHEDKLEKAYELAGQENYTQACQIAKEIINKDNLYAPAYYLLGVLNEKMGNHKEAIDDFQRLLYIDEKLSVGYLHLGNLYRAIGNQQKARKEYLNCLKFLEKIDENEVMQLSNGMTAGVLYQAVHRALETLE